MSATAQTLELPRPAQLLRTTGWNLTESFGLPLAGYALAAWLYGRNAGMLAMLAAIWVTAIARKIISGSVPGLVMIAMVVLSVQAVVAVATGSLWLFLLHFPLANLGLAIVFARSARGHSPLAARLAAEVIGLRTPAIHRPRLHRFFQHVTVLWAGLFLLLAVCLGTLLVTVPTVTYVPLWAIITIMIITAGVGICARWLRLVLRKLGIGLRFGPAAPRLPAVAAWNRPPPGQADGCG